jgi:hypothetical protein
MDDDKLSHALRSLPRTAARPGFTDAVRRRIEADSPSGRRVRGPAHWPVRAALAAVCLLLLVLGGREGYHHHQRQQTMARLAKLEAERQALVAELESLHRQMDMAQPVVYLGGNNELDLVLDLAELQRAGYRPADFRAEPRRQAGPRQAGPRQAGPRLANFEEPRTPTIY